MPRFSLMSVNLLITSADQPAVPLRRPSLNICIVNRLLCCCCCCWYCWRQSGSQKELAGCVCAEETLIIGYKNTRAGDEPRQNWKKKSDPPVSLTTDVIKSSFQRLSNWTFRTFHFWYITLIKKFLEVLCFWSFNKIKVIPAKGLRWKKSKKKEGSIFFIAPAGGLNFAR